MSYDPIEDAGVIVVSSAFLDSEAVDDTLELIEDLESLPFRPVLMSLEETTDTEPDNYRLLAPSSITLDDVLLSRGVNANLSTAGVLEYTPTNEDESDNVVTSNAELGGQIIRYVDIIADEKARPSTSPRCSLRRIRVIFPVSSKTAIHAFSSAMTASSRSTGTKKHEI